MILDLRILKGLEAQILDLRILKGLAEFGELLMRYCTLWVNSCQWESGAGSGRSVGVKHKEPAAL